MATLLCELAIEHGVDKCPAIFHSYTPAYHEILEPVRTKIRSVLEIGIGTKSVMCGIVGNAYRPGASLRMWRDYFPSAEVHGCDIDSSVLFREERIRTFHVDQSDPSSLHSMLEKIRGVARSTDFDLIIDDGSHVVEHMTTSFSALWPNVAADGLYIIEDIKAADRSYFETLPETLKIDNARLIRYHRGVNDWDDFAVFQKKDSQPKR